MAVEIKHWESPNYYEIREMDEDYKTKKRHLVHYVTLTSDEIKELINLFKKEGF